MAQESETRAIQPGAPLWWMTYARYIGLDIHREYVTAVGIDLGKNVVLRVRRIDLSDFPDWVSRHLTREDAVVLESTTNAWTIYDLVAPVVGRCVVMHPDRKKRVKTDLLDAEELARRLFYDDITEVWVPPESVRDLRELMAYRHRKVGERTRILNRLKSVLHACGIEQPADRIAAQKRRDWWDEVDISHPKRLKVELDLATFDTLTAQVQVLDKEVGRLSTSDEWGEEMVYLMQIPGIGLIHGMTILGAIGDISRFENPHKLVGYAGLGAKVEQSGNTEIRGRITKSGRRELRRSLVEAARIAVRQKGRWMKTYNRLVKRIGEKKAIVAVARKLLVVIWHVLRKHEVDRDANPDVLAAKFMKWSWQMDAAARRGMMLKEFIRYCLTILGFGDWDEVLIRGGRERPIVSLTQLLERYPELSQDPRFELAAAQGP